MKYCFFKLLQHRDWTSVQNAIQSNPILAAQRDSLGCTTLHTTCSLHPTFEILSIIYQKFPSAIKMTDGQSRLPLHVAVMHGADPEILQALISYYPEALVKKDCRGQLPLHHLLLWNTTPGNEHPNAFPSSRYEYHSTFPMDILMLLLPFREKYCLHRCSKSSKNNFKPMTDTESLITTHRDMYGYTPLALSWESYRSVVPWNEEEYEERRQREWKKLEVLLFSSYYGMPHPNNAHVVENNDSMSVSSHRRIHHQFFSMGIGMLPPTLPFSTGSSNSKFKLLHAAVGMGAEYWCPHELFFLLIEKYSAQIQDVNEEGNLPLMMCLDPKIPAQDTLTDFSRLQNLEKRSTIYSSLQANNAPSSSSSGVLPRPFSNVFIKPLLLHHPAAAQIPHTKTNQLPLHVALHNQRGWFEGVEDIFNAHPEALYISDPVTGFLPFCIPSLSLQNKQRAKNSCTVQTKEFKEKIDSFEEKFCIETIYHLIKADPSVLSLPIDKKSD